MEMEEVFYKEQIIEIVNQLEDVSMLMYLYYFIKGKVKAGE
jgi:hypothetical protein